MDWWFCSHIWVLFWGFSRQKKLLRIISLRMERNLNLLMRKLNKRLEKLKSRYPQVLIIFRINCLILQILSNLQSKELIYSTLMSAKQEWILASMKRINTRYWWSIGSEGRLRLFANQGIHLSKLEDLHKNLSGLHLESTWEICCITEDFHTHSLIDKCIDT